MSHGTRIAAKCTCRCQMNLYVPLLQEALSHNIPCKKINKMKRLKSKLPLVYEALKEYSEDPECQVDVDDLLKVLPDAFLHDDAGTPTPKSPAETSVISPTSSPTLSPEPSQVVTPFRDVSSVQFVTLLKY